VEDANLSAVDEVQKLPKTRQTVLQADTHGEAQKKME